MKLSKPLKRIYSFSSRYKRIAKEGLHGKKMLATLVTFLSVVAASVSGITLIVVGKVIDALQSNTVVDLPLFDLSLSGHQLMTSAAVGIAILLFISSYAAYYSRAITRTIARNFYTNTTKKILDLVDQRTIYISHDSKGDFTSVRQMVNRNVAHVSRALEKMILLLQPLSYSVAAIITASYFSPFLSLVAYSLFLLLIIPLYKKSSELNDNSRNYFQQSTGAMSKTLRDYVKQIDVGSFRSQSTGSLGGYFTNEPAVIDYLDRLDKLRLGPANMIFITSLFMSVAVGSCMLVIGYILIEEEKELGTALAFMGALMILLKSLRGLGTSLAFLNRFYPQAVDYLSYYDYLDSLPNDRGLKFPESLIMHASEHLLMKSSADVKLVKGSPVLLVTENRLNRSNLGLIGGALLRSCKLDGYYGVDYRTGPLSPLDISFNEYLQVESGYLYRKNLSTLKKFKVWREIESLPNGADNLIDEDALEQLSRKCSCLIATLSLTWSKHELIFLTANLFKEFSDDDLLEMWKLLNDKYIFILSGNSNDVFSGIRVGCVLEKEEIISVGDDEWLRGLNIDHKKNIKNSSGMDDIDLYDEDDMD